MATTISIEYDSMSAVPKGTFVRKPNIRAKHYPSDVVLEVAPWLFDNRINDGELATRMKKFTVDPSLVMKKYRVVAVVGASKNPEKDANSVPAYLHDRGYTIIPINPTADSINGLKAYPSLSDIPDELARRVEVVDVFRPSEELPQVARQVVEMKKKTGRPFVFWGQLGLENDEAKRILLQGEVEFVMDRCMRTEHKMISS